MRKLRNYYLSALLISGLGFMSSCGSDDDEPTPTPVTPKKEMSTYTAKILGNQQASAGSFFASTDGTIYNSADAKANSGKIDLVYYYSTGGTAAADSATIASPSDATAQLVYGSTTTANIPSWTTKNVTMFKYLGSNVATFNNLTNGDEVMNTYMGSTATAASSIDLLEVNDVFAFKTAAGKHGVAKVTNITMPVATTTPAFQSAITLDVKVEK